MWQPIETVPRDGSDVLTLWVAPTGNYYKVQAWNRDGRDLETNTLRSGLMDESTNFVDT